MNVVPFEPSRTKDLGALLDTDPGSRGCWCMWFIIPVKAYHEAKGYANRDAFVGLAASDPHPLGLMAYEGDHPVGWCAVGPRTRYLRALGTPTLKGRDRAEDGSVWLVPCFLIRRDQRSQGVASTLLAAAVELARERGATAIEGFPLAGDKRRSSGSDLQTGVESLFAGCGFAAVSRPSDNRVVMRREF
jgi:GNAT superfamily N-acetyltransferase